MTITTTQEQTALTSAEQRRLQEFETTIERGLQTFYEVGYALAEIREQRLYRAEYGTFEDYCRDRWQMSDSRARRLIYSSEVVDNVKSVPIGTLPTNEAQTRPLAKLPAEEQGPAWEEAVERSGGKPTARHVEEVVKERTQPPAPERQRIDSLPGEERTKLFEKLSRRRLRINGGSYNKGKREYLFVRDVHVRGDMNERHTITYVDEAEALLTMVVPPAPPSQWARPVEEPEPEPPARVGSTGPVVDIGIAPGAKVKLKAVTGVFLKATQEQEGIRAWVKWPSGIVESIDPDILIVEKPEEPELPEQQPVAHPTIRQCMIDAYRLIKAGDKEGAHLQAQRFRAHPDIAGIIGHAIWGMQCAMEGDT
jgi:hypothetical protein